MRKMYIIVALTYHNDVLHRALYWNTETHYLCDGAHPEIKCPHPSFSLKQAIEDAMWWPAEEVRKSGEKPDLQLNILTSDKDYVYDVTDNKLGWKWTGHYSRVEEYRYNYDTQLWDDII